jgi:riboflavin kinase/FMN adenylyltransferase
MIVSVYPEGALPSEARPVVTLGNFDGVHIGHQDIMRKLKSRARELSAPSVAVTFEPLPVSVLRPEGAPGRIQTPEQKQETIATLGIDHLWIIPFTIAFSRKEPEDFVREVVVGKLRAAELILGSNFRFGHGRAGGLDTLRVFGRELGFTVVEVEPALVEGEMISSSRVRRVLSEGDAEKAAAMLGRPYFVDGKVVQGDGRGRLIGFHTANLNLTGSLLLEDGVYVTSARLGDRRHCGMSHIGRRPTFGLDSRTVETHLFDFSREIYGSWVRLYFHHRIRGTQTFEGPEALKRQLGSDREEAARFFRDPERNLML